MKHSARDSAVVNGVFDQSSLRAVGAVIGKREGFHGVCPPHQPTFQVVIPRRLSGVLLKALGLGIIHLYFCNNIFAEKHIVESSDSAIIFFNVRMDCSTKTSDFKQKEAALIFTLSSS